MQIFFGHALFILILVLLVGIPKPALIQGIFHIGELLVATKLAPKKLKTFFFQHKFCFLKAHAHYFTVLIYFASNLKNC